MKAQELREKTDDELRKELVAEREALFNLRVRRETEQTENPAEVRKIRKNIARVLTILRERKAGG